MTLQFDWSEKRLFSYGMDRFLVATVKKEMQADPFHHSVLFDEKQKLYITNVHDDRWGVIWQLTENDSKAVMKYVLPTQFRTYDPAQMREFVARAVPIASNGRFTLADLVPEFAQEPAPAPSPASPKAKPRPFSL